MTREEKCLSKHCLSLINKWLKGKQQQSVVIADTETAQKDD